MQTQSAPRTLAVVVNSPTGERTFSYPASHYTFETQDEAEAWIATLAEGTRAEIVHAPRLHTEPHMTPEEYDASIAQVVAALLELTTAAPYLACSYTAR